LAMGGGSSTVHCHGFGCFSLSDSSWTTMVGSIFGWLLYHQRLCHPYGEPVEKVAGLIGGKNCSTGCFNALSELWRKVCWHG
jgi:hypothetical protein